MEYYNGILDGMRFYLWFVRTYWFFFVGSLLKIRFSTASFSKVENHTPLEVMDVLEMSEDVKMFNKVFPFPSPFLLLSSFILTSPLPILTDYKRRSSPPRPSDHLFC